MHEEHGPSLGHLCLTAVFPKKSLDLQMSILHSLLVSALRCPSLFVNIVMEIANLPVEAMHPRRLEAIVILPRYITQAQDAEALIHIVAFRMLNCGLRTQEISLLGHCDSQFGSCAEG
jgi:hypothetical protein